MTMQAFLRTNRIEIDASIRRAVTGQSRGQLDSTTPRLNDAERRLWILNDEALYNWARSEGVRI